MLVGVIYSIF